MAITQGTQSVELYFNDGQLMCVGPVRADCTLAERLAQDGMISQQALEDVMHILEPASLCEASIARTLVTLEYIQRDDLRTWMTQKIIEVFRVLLTWKSGSIDFVENVGKPAERLLVSLSISSLLDMLSIPTNSKLQTSDDTPLEEYAAMETQLMAASQPSHQSFTRQESSPRHAVELKKVQSLQEPAQKGSTSTATLSKLDITQAATLYESSQFSARPTESPLPLPASALHTVLPMPDMPDTTMPASSLFDMDVLLSGLHDSTISGPDFPLRVAPLATTPAPYSPQRKVNIPVMKADMVMIPADFSNSREQYVEITPEQWQLLTRVDGKTSLEEVCHVYQLSPEHVLRTASQLIVAMLIEVVPPHMAQAQQSSSVLPLQPPTPEELSPTSRELITAGLHNGLVAPGSYASFASPWGDVLPDSDIVQLPPSLETQSQWGNGGNGASLVLGQGWVAPVERLQSVPSNGSFTIGSGPYPTVQRI